MQETRPQQMMTFIRTLSELEELTLKRLTTTVEEERSRKELLERSDSARLVRTMSSKAESTVKENVDLVRRPVLGARLRAARRRSGGRDVT